MDCSPEEKLIPSRHTFIKAERRGPGGLLQDILRPGSPKRKSACQVKRKVEEHKSVCPVNQKVEERALLDGGAGPRPELVQLVAKPLEASPPCCLSLVRDPSPGPCYSPHPAERSMSPQRSHFYSVQCDSSASTPSEGSFSGFLLQSEPPQSRISVEDGQSGRHECVVRLAEQGMLVDCSTKARSTTFSFGWSQKYEIPWAAIIEACAVETPRAAIIEAGACRVVRLRTAKSSSAVRSAEVDIYFAFKDQDQDHSAQFLSSIRCWKRWHFARRCQTAFDEYGMSSAEVALSDFAGLAIESDAGSSAAAVPHSLSNTISVASLSRQRYFLKDERGWESARDSIPKDRKDTCQDTPPVLKTGVVETLSPDGATVWGSNLNPPAPLEIQAVWIHWTSPESSNAFFSAFCCSVLCIDKLGLTARPHATSHGRTGDLIHISMSSVLWIGQGQRPCPVLNQKGNQKHNIFADIKSAVVGISGYTVEPPQEDLLPSNPPHPHVVRVEVRSTRTAGRAGKSEKSGVLVMTISVRTQHEADTILRAAMEHRRHQLLAAIRTSLPGSLTNRVSRTVSTPDYVERCASRDTERSSLSPPPPPPRPAALPPAHQLPQMVASAKGDVFWHLPPQRANSHQHTPRRGDATPPWFESPSGAR